MLLVFGGSVRLIEEESQKNDDESSSLHPGKTPSVVLQNYLEQVIKMMFLMNTKPVLIRVKILLHMKRVNIQSHPLSQLMMAVTNTISKKLFKSQILSNIIGLSVKRILYLCLYYERYQSD
ncbi:hypothetical protein Avbf_11455 [Armadillidium vulgare]|nr:hypothetical protein Avbf_11455 [Armadillidium vulgare]